MIVFAPVYDEVTRLLKRWVDWFVERFRSRVTVYISGGGATRERLWAALASYPGEPVFVATHGIPAGVEDGERLPALSACTSDRLLSGHPTYLLSCWAGDVLAFTAAAKRCPGVIAYVKPVMIVFREEVERFFRDCLLSPAEALAHGMSPVKAYHYAQRRCREMLAALAGRGGELYREAYRLLKHDVDSMVVVTPKATLPPQPPKPVAAALGTALAAEVALIALLAHLTS